MPKFLKGNYELSNESEDAPDEPETVKTLTERFEESALAKLGGSICFVRKEKTLLWAGDSDEDAG